MPLRRDGELRKRWRYVGLFAPELMLCCARAQIGPLTQSFWVLWDREGRRALSHTAVRPGSREVSFDGAAVEIDAAGLRASLRLGACEPVESICPAAEGDGWGWTRKRAGVPIAAAVAVPGRSWRLEGAGVDDESAGYHARRTSWRWSAGVGEAADGRALAWNLVEGVNDPERGSERGLWLDGVPSEPGRVAFADDGTAIACADGSRLEFAAESEHARDDDYLLLSSSYRHAFGSFSGAIEGVALASGLGVMERHEALW
jgi:hypothetical protein